MYLPHSENLPIEILAHSFNDTTNSYKFYWFLAILDELIETNSETISLDSLSIRMVSEVWYPLDYFKLSFGKQDSFKNISDFVSQKIPIDNSPKSEHIFSQINKKLNDSDLNILKLQVRNLIKYVPYRFIRPFFANELRGEKDSNVNRQIIEFAIKEFYNKKPFYYFNENSIKLHPDWKDYFNKHVFILKGFIYWNLIQFLQKNNPNVIGLSEKLFKPIKRDLRLAQSFWKEYIDIKQNINCIYSGNSIGENLSIDHFIPWSYIAHDNIWNLLPTTKSVNSSKGDNFPSFNKYFNSFIDLQYDAYQTIYTSNPKEKIKYLEDYTIIFNSDMKGISELSKSQFCSRIENLIKPMYQIAENMGFNSNWIYK
jgi:hypothetical protein